MVQAKVLIATDAAGRVLELLLALERAWTGGRLPYPLAMVTGGFLLHVCMVWTRENREACLVVMVLCMPCTTVGEAACRIHMQMPGQRFVAAAAQPWVRPARHPVKSPCVACPMAGAAKPSAVETAKSQLQWMADGLQRSFEAERDNPNPFSLQCAHSRTILRQMPPFTFASPHTQQHQSSCPEAAADDAQGDCGQP
jgi:hypothetical protein